MRQSKDDDMYVHVDTSKISVEGDNLYVSNILYVAFCNIVVVLCLIWFCLDGIISLYIYCLHNFTGVHTSLLEASYASTGGVLLLLEHVSDIVLCYVSMYNMSHPMTVEISDAT